MLSVLRVEWLVAEQMADGVRADMFYQISSDANADLLSPSLFCLKMAVSPSTLIQGNVVDSCLLEWLARERACDTRCAIVAVSVSVIHALPDQRACACTHAHARLENAFY